MRGRRSALYLSTNIVILSVVSLLNDISSEIILPILPIFIASLGGGGLIIGLIGGLDESISGLAKILSGYYADRLKRRRVFIFSGYFTSSISKLLLPLSTIWQHIVAIRPLDRLGKGIRTPPRDALIADSSSDEGRGRAFGFHRAFDSSGAVAGSIICLALFVYFGFSLNLIILVAALLSVLALIPILAVKDPERIKHREKIVFKFRNLPRPLFNFFVISGVFTLANFSYMFLIIWATGGGLVFSSDQVSLALLLYIVFNVVYALLSFPAGSISDRLGRKKTLLIGYFMFALTNIVFLINLNLIGLVVGFILYGAFNALFESTQRAFVVDLSPEEFRGTVLGSFHMMISILTLFSSLIVGFVWSAITPPAIFIYGAVLATVAASLLFKLDTDTKTKVDVPPA